mmetsp:Transcript_23888/g.38085  ORF Transcript_23888/g.38085 Transcript_23888/m.38085 type:complete len:211 (-) Transcript_23888:1174-1806(-)
MPLCFFHKMHFLEDRNSVNLSGIFVNRILCSRWKTCQSFSDRIGFSVKRFQFCSYSYTFEPCIWNHARSFQPLELPLCVVDFRPHADNLVCKLHFLFGANRRHFLDIFMHGVNKTVHDILSTVYFPEAPNNVVQIPSPSLSVPGHHLGEQLMANNIFPQRFYSIRTWCVLVEILADKVQYVSFRILAFIRIFNLLYDYRLVSCEVSQQVW